MVMLPYDLDVESELAKVKKQNDENMQDNIDTMKRLGYNKETEKEEVIEKEENKDITEE